jgi:hypothetical protein
MIREFAGRVEFGVVVTALRNLRDRDLIVVDRVGDRRGYRASSMQNEGQDIENA